MKDFTLASVDGAEIDARIVAGLQRAVGHAITVGVQKARNEHKWKHVTGATGESINGEVQNSSKGATGEMTAGLNAVRMNDGTKPHVIAPVNAHYLKFKVGGTTMFRRTVNHPGTTGDHFLDNAAQAAEDVLEAGVDAAIAEAFGS